MKFSENSHIWIPVVLHRIVTWVHWFYVASLCLKWKTLGIFIGILILYPFAPHQYSFLLVRKYKEERVQPILIFCYFKEQLFISPFHGRSFLCHSPSKVSILVLKCLPFTFQVDFVSLLTRVHFRKLKIYLESRSYMVGWSLEWDLLKKMPNYLWNIKLNAS